MKYKMMIQIKTRRIKERLGNNVEKSSLCISYKYTQDNEENKRKTNYLCEIRHLSQFWRWLG